jgi:glutamate racemase
MGFYKELKKRVDAPALYFSDNGFTPYGRTATAELERRLHSIFRFLFDIGATHICIACNAASSAYRDNDNVNGIIHHGVDALRRGRWPKIGLIAGRRTVVGPGYRAWPHRRRHVARALLPPGHRRGVAGGHPCARE